LQDHHIGRLIENLKIFEEYTLTLQRDNITFSDVRACFDYLIAKFPDDVAVKQYLAHDADIVQSPLLESALIKLQESNASEITPREKAVIECFRKNFATTAPTQNDERDPLHIAKARRMVLVKATDYVDTSFVPPTSSLAERLFSRAKHVKSDDRGRLTDEHFDDRMILLLNDSYWDATLVGEAIISCARASRATKEDTTAILEQEEITQ
jgi:hypothetical protein